MRESESMHHNRSVGVECDSMGSLVIWTMSQFSFSFRNPVSNILKTLQNQKSSHIVRPNSPRRMHVKTSKQKTGSMADHAGRAGSLIFCCELLPVPRIRLLSQDTNLFLSLKLAFSNCLQLAYTAAVTLVCLAHSYCFISLILIRLFHYVYK